MGQMLRACFEGDLVRLIEVTRVAAGCANRLVAFFGQVEESRHYLCHYDGKEVRWKGA